jgi:hypothetical protein
MKTASQSPIKGFFRIVPEFFPNSDVYGIGYDREGEDAFATEDRMRSGNTSCDSCSRTLVDQQIERSKSHFQAEPPPSQD